MLNNFTFKLRQLVLRENLINSYFEFKFKAKSYLALWRGFIAKLKGIVIKNKSSSQILLIGHSVDWLVQAQAAIELKSMQNFASSEKPHPYNPIFPNAASIGHYSHWKFLNPPVNRNTRLRMQTGSRLLLESNILICSGTYISIWPGKTLEIGENTIIGHECYLNTKSGLKIGKNCIVGQGTRIMDYDGHPIFHLDSKTPLDRYGGATAPITIDDNVWIGFGVVIMKGVKIGTGSIIATNSWVTQDIKPNSFVAGSPARLIQENVSWKQF